MWCRGVQAEDDKRQGTGVALEIPQPLATHLWSVKERQTWSRTKLDLGLTKKWYLAHIKAIVYSKCRCNVELQTNEERVEV